MFPKHRLLSCHFNVSPTNVVVKNDVFIFASVVHLARHLSLFKCNYSDWWLSPCTPLCLSASHYISMCLLCTMCFVCMKEWNCISSFACTFDYMCAQLNDFDCYLWLWGFTSIPGQLDLWHSIDVEFAGQALCLNWCFCWHVDRCQLQLTEHVTYQQVVMLQWSRPWRHGGIFFLVVLHH